MPLVSALCHLNPMSTNQFSVSPSLWPGNTVRQQLRESTKKSNSGWRNDTKAVHQLLTHAREKLDRLVNVLLQEETAAQQRLAEILGPRPECTPLKMNNGTMESTPPSPLERS